jgi:hypothetical protein
MMHAFLDREKPPLAIIADKANGSTKKLDGKSPKRAHYASFRQRVTPGIRLPTRFEKYVHNFLAMLHIFAIKCWIN